MPWGRYIDIAICLPKVFMVPKAARRDISKYPDPARDANFNNQVHSKLQLCCVRFIVRVLTFLCYSESPSIGRIVALQIIREVEKTRIKPTARLNNIRRRYICRNVDI